MIDVRITVDEKLEKVSEADIKKGCWIHLIAPHDSEIDFVAQKTGISEQMLKVALDDEERAHIDKEDKNTLVVIDTPHLEEDDYGEIRYTTMPLGIIYNGEYIVTVCLKENVIVSDFFEGRIKQFQTYKRMRNMLLILQRNATKFIHHLRHLDKMSNRLQAELNKSMKNQELLQLMELEKSLVYYETSINSNEFVLEKIMTLEEIKTYPEDIELLDDVILDNKQASEMCKIYSGILSSTMDAFASVVSNNLNIVMKVLTIITISLSFPTLIASLWGMNVSVPFGGHPAGFWIVFAIIIAVTIIGTVFIMKVNVRSGKRKKKDKPDKRK
jgi:magnesium transporter